MSWSTKIINKIFKSCCINISDRCLCYIFEAYSVSYNSIILSFCLFNWGFLGGYRLFNEGIGPFYIYFAIITICLLCIIRYMIIGLFNSSISSSLYFAFICTKLFGRFLATVCPLKREELFLKKDFKDCKTIEIIVLMFDHGFYSFFYNNIHQPGNVLNHMKDCGFIFKEKNSFSTLVSNLLKMVVLFWNGDLPGDDKTKMNNAMELYASFIIKGVLIFFTTFLFFIILKKALSYLIVPFVRVNVLLSVIFFIIRIYEAYYKANDEPLDKNKPILYIIMIIISVLLLYLGKYFDNYFSLTIIIHYITSLFSSVFLLIASFYFIITINEFTFSKEGLLLFAKYKPKVKVSVKEDWEKFINIFYLFSSVPSSSELLDNIGLLGKVIFIIIILGPLFISLIVGLYKKLFNKKAEPEDYEHHSNINPNKKEYYQYLVGGLIAFLQHFG